MKNDYDDDWGYEDQRESEPCDHESADFDVISGRAYCPCCREAWSMTNAEIAAETRFMCEAAEMEFQCQMEEEAHAVGV